jgi:germination protein M
VKFVKASGKRILVGIGILIMIGLVSGCTEAQKFTWERLKETHYKMVLGKKNYQKNKIVSVDKGLAPVKKVSVALYFANQTGDYLKVEKREIKMVPGIARATVEELIKGPGEKGLSRTFPDGVKLLDINIQDKLCTVDFSKELRDNHWGGSTGEIITVYSLVNTLTQFAAVDKVEILIEGQKIDTLAGHLDLSTPVSRNANIIKDI